MKLLFALFILFLISPLAAQYDGGSGEGTDRRTTIQLSLDGIPGGIRPLYAGGRGDGHSKQLTSASLSGFSTAAFYGGGQGDGHSQSQASLSLSGINLMSLYGGGEGERNWRCKR